MKQDLGDQDIYIVADETHLDGGGVLDITIGSLNDENISTYMLATKLPTNPSGLIIANKIKEALYYIWDNDELF